MFIGSLLHGSPKALEKIRRVCFRFLWVNQKENFVMGNNGKMFISWNDYIRALKTWHIRLKDKEDELVWQHIPFGFYMQKSRYT
jgi:hypothetical protein